MKQTPDRQQLPKCCQPAVRRLLVAALALVNALVVTSFTGRAAASHPLAGSPFALRTARLFIVGLTPGNHPQLAHTGSILFPVLYERRLWTDTKGHELVGDYLGLSETGQVRLNIDGEVLEFPLNGFSQQDQNWIAEFEERTSKLQKKPVQPIKPGPDQGHSTPELKTADPEADAVAETQRAAVQMEQLKARSEEGDELLDDEPITGDFTEQLQAVLRKDAVGASFRCNICGTRYTAEDEMVPGDLCPRCSSQPFQFKGRMIRAVIAFVALFVGLLGFSLKKLFPAQSAADDGRHNY